jgi:hypothetical protein
VAGPWLLDVAEGRHALGDPATARTAALLSHEVRDDLHLPGLLDGALRRRIRALRAAGTDVVLQPPGGDPVDTAVTLRLLDRLIDHADCLDRVIAYFATSSTLSSALVVVPTLARDRAMSVLRAVDTWPHEVVDDAFSTSIRLRHVQRSVDGPPPPDPL